MKETKKEKFIRYLFIIIFASIAMIGFVWRYESNSIEETNSPMALVLQSKDTSNPYVVLYDMKKGEHVLALYEVELDRSYYFKTIKGFTLSHKIDQLKKDKERGFWIQMKGNWHYFNEHMEEEERPKSYMAPTNGSLPFTEVTKENQMILQVDDDTNLMIEKRKNEQVKEVHPLSCKGRCWLIITNFDVKVVTS